MKRSGWQQIVRQDGAVLLAMFHDGECKELLILRRGFVPAYCYACGRTHANACPDLARASLGE